MSASTLVKLLSSFVPKMIQKRALQDPTPIDAPVLDHFYSVVMFADISGFTALTEKLAQRGPVGVETLAHILNAYFGQLIDIINKHGGDVVKFAGDAIIAIWPVASSSGTADSVSEEALRQMTLRATECAVEVRGTFLDYKTENSTLYLKLALATGHIIQTHIGGVFNRWEFALTGTPLVELGVANDLANAGDVIMSPSALALIQKDGEFESIDFKLNGETVKAAKLKKLNEASQLPAGDESLDIPVELQSALSPYIPGSIVNRISVGQSEWLAELRKVTIVFVDVLEPEQISSIDVAQNLMHVIQRITYRFEGSVNKISQDDKGIMIDTAYGLPPLAHEDDPLRGVQAAMMIRDELHALGIHSAIGITTGRVFCGLVGNDVRRVYTFLGNSVNLAARLMVLGANNKEVLESEGVAIVCDRATYDASNDQVDFETLSPQKVKGRSEPVEIFRPLRSKTTVARKQTQLIGRQAETNILAEALLQLQRGSTLQTVVLQGEAGIGKSQLMEDLIRQAQASDIRVLISEADSIEKNNPYYAWRSTFNQVFGIDEILRKPQLTKDDRNSIRELVLAKLEQLDANLLKYVPLLNVLFPVSFPENEFTLALTGETRGGNIRELLVKVLQHQAVLAPLLIVVEDLHWYDSASWTLLSDVHQHVRPMMLVVTSRPFSGQVPQEFKVILEKADTQLINLEAMALDDVESLVCQRLGVASIPPVVGRMIREKSEGNPFFAEELAFALRDSGVLILENQQSRLALGSENLENVSLPDNLQAAITSRIDGLNPPEQLAIKVASVIGRIFTYRVLEAIHPIESDRPELRAYLDDLTRLSLTLVEDATPDLAYIFKHAVTQDAAYNLMLFSQRRQLHQAVAEWIEQNHKDDIDSFYTLLAYHWMQAAQDPDPVHRELVTGKAKEYLERAGNQSLKNFANTEAIEFFNDLLSYVDVEQADKLYLGGIYRKLGDAYLGLGKLAEAKDYITKAMKNLGLPLPSSDLGLVFGVLRHVAIQTMHRMRPDRYRELDLSPEEEERRMNLVILAEKLVVVQFLNGDPNPLPMLFGVIAGLNMGETMRSTPEAWALYATTSAVAGFVPLESQATHYKKVWREMGEEFDDPNSFVDGAIALCASASGKGEWQEVRDLIEKAHNICEELGDHRRNAEAVAYIAVNGLMEGGPKLAEGYNKLEWEIAMRRENPIHMAFGYQVDCSGLVWMGEYETCISEAKKCLALSEQSWVGEYPEYIVRTAMWLAMWLNGERDGVWDGVKAALDKFSKGTAADFSAHLIDLHLAELTFQALEEGRERGWPKEQMTDIEKYAKIAIKNLKKASGIFTIGLPAFNRFSGMLEWHNGKPDKAFQFWRTAIEKAHAFPMKYEEARANLELGRHLEIGAERTICLEKAAMLFNECGLGNWTSMVKSEQAN